MLCYLFTVCLGGVFFFCLNFSEKPFGKPLKQEKGTCVSKLTHQEKKRNNCAWAIPSRNYIIS